MSYRDRQFYKIAFAPPDGQFVTEETPTSVYTSTSDAATSTASEDDSASTSDVYFSLSSGHCNVDYPSPGPICVSEPESLTPVTPMIDDGPRRVSDQETSTDRKHRNTYRTSAIPRLLSIYVRRSLEDDRSASAENPHDAGDVTVDRNELGGSGDHQNTTENHENQTEFVDSSSNGDMNISKETGVGSQAIPPKEDEGKKEKDEGERRKGGKTQPESEAYKATNNLLLLILCVHVFIMLILVTELYCNNQTLHEVEMRQDVLIRNNNFMLALLYGFHNQLEEFKLYTCPEPHRNEENVIYMPPDFNKNETTGNKTNSSSLNKTTLNQNQIKHVKAIWTNVFGFAQIFFGEEFCPFIEDQCHRCQPPASSFNIFSWLLSFFY